MGEGNDGGLGEGIDEGLGGGIDSGGGDEVRRLESAEVIMCLCDCKVEKGEMVCCDVCEGWSHLRCMGMKEGVGLMEGKVFVCHFCLSVCLLALQIEVRELKKELHISKSEVKGLREKNGKLKEHIEHDRSGEVRVAQKEVVTNMTKSEIVVGDEAMPEQGVNNKEVGEKKAPNVGRQGCEVKKLRRVVKWMAGARKVWGTYKKEWLRWGGRWNLASLYRSG